MNISSPLERQTLENKIANANLEELRQIERDVETASIMATDFVEKRLAYFLKLDIQERRRLLALAGATVQREVEQR